MAEYQLYCFAQSGNAYRVALGRRPSTVLTCSCAALGKFETLHEINIDGRADALKAGMARFRMMPAVGDSPAFIGALRDLVLRAVEIHPESVSSSAA